MRRQGSFWLWLAVAIGAFGALVYYLATVFPEAVNDPERRMELVGAIAWTLLVGSAAVVHIREKPSAALKSLGIWLLIAGVLLAGYSYRHEFRALGNRMLGELLPHRGSTGQGTVSFQARAGGGFVVDAEVNGTSVRFLVDTGATDVVLSPADARRLGFDLSKLSFDKRYRTANGIVLGAPVRLKRVAVGPVSVEDVRASVNGADLSHSLLGMSFLERLSSWDVKNGTLTLRK